MTGITDEELLAVRGEVGSAPDDATISDLYDDLTGQGRVGWRWTAIQILKQRLADQLSGSSARTINIHGALMVQTAQRMVTDTQYLRTQVRRLQAEASGPMCRSLERSPTRDWRSYPWIGGWYGARGPIRR